eukprot:gene22320-29395_t
MSLTSTKTLSYGSQRIASQRSSSYPVSSRAPFHHRKFLSTSSRVPLATRCSANASTNEASRRDVMLSTASLIALSAFPAPPPAMADDLVPFYGAASPPATPSKKGGVIKSNARYGFKYPESWKEDAINKVEKGTNGTDVRFSGPARKKEKVFVLTLLNYGGTAGFTMDQEPVNLLKSLTGSLFDFQDALDAGTLTTSTVEKNGQKYFEYNLDGPDSYIIQLTVTDGRVFGFFLSAAAKSFAADAELLRAMTDSFETYSQ